MRIRDELEGVRMLSGEIYRLSTANDRLFKNRLKDIMTMANEIGYKVSRIGEALDDIKESICQKS